MKPFSETKAFAQPVLSRHDLLDIAEAISRDFAPRFAPASPHQSGNCLQLSRQELLTISEQISREYTPRSSTQNNKLVLLPVTPDRLHAYWHFHNETVPANPDNTQPQPELTLRIFLQTAEQAETPEQTASNWFDISVEPTQIQQSITLPHHSAGQMTAVLGSRGDKSNFHALLYSNTTQIPDSDAKHHPLSPVLSALITPYQTPSSISSHYGLGQGSPTTT